MEPSDVAGGLKTMDRRAAMGEAPVPVDPPPAPERKEGQALASEELDIDTMLLTGEGAFEGLSAYLVVDWSSEPAVFQGAINPRDMPPTP